MVNNKTIKLLTSVILILIMIVALVGSTVYATDTLKTKISRNRYNSSGEAVEAYAIHNGDDYPIFQILSVDSSDRILSNNIYCLNAEVGSTWMNNIIDRKSVV